MKPAHPKPQDIRQARTDAGLTLQQAADLAGYGAAPRWAEIESGRKRMDSWRWLFFLHRAGLQRLPFKRQKPL